MAVIQIISKSDWKSQMVVPVTSLPGALTEPNSVRIKTQLISLTTNTFTYARLGGIVPAMGWWHVWKLPVNILPEPYNDNTKYTRISAWGFSEVIESTIPELKKGTKLYGYQPIGTAPEDLVLEKDDNVSGHWLERSEYRKDLAGIYNRYVVHEDLDDTNKYDALMMVLWGTGYLMNRFNFAWEHKPVHPFGLPDPDGQLWGEKEADLSEAVVILLAASGKTGLGFANELRQRPEGKRPLKIVAVGSEQSKQFTLRTGLFDEVWRYDQVGEYLDSLGPDKVKKIVLADFASRGSSGDEWAIGLRKKTDNFLGLIVGGDPLKTSPNKVMTPSQDPKGEVLQVHGGVVRERAFEDVGIAGYFEGYAKAWEAFKRSKAVENVKVDTGRGPYEFKEGWDRLAKGEYAADVGLVYEF
ncbi:hypothetical protein QBC35DRAFT_506904 [Podospora australis]|uniref:Uncharacterized protein n=1 Tax=Podospora australis TaxID=1536484 RepID=A0AAN6WLB7_9PEZI|nr:hypothetical protein QBC35DRAFT_506904 [Podospora australis]